MSNQGKNVPWDETGTESETDICHLQFFPHKSGVKDEDVLQVSDFDSDRKASERLISVATKMFL